MDKSKKVVGTAVPLAAIFSEKNVSEGGTFRAGESFIDWIGRSKQSAWQLLPLHQTSLVPGSGGEHVPSPYKGYGVGLDPRYLSKASFRLIPRQGELERFSRQHAAWLADYLLFCSLRDHLDGDDWTRWSRGIRTRDPEAVSYWRRKLASRIQDHLLTQWRLHHEYSRLRAKAKKSKVLLIGDLPFYLGLKSPLVWAHQDLFDLTRKGEMRRVSGLPDGPKAHFGRQVWGHPLYRWSALELQEKIVDLWKVRLKYTSELFDLVRLDHAKGMFYYGSIDPKKEKNDQIKPGPGAAVLEELVNYSRSISLMVFAEDSGDRLEGLRATLKKLRVPGVRVFRYGLTVKKGEEIHREYARIFSYPENVVAFSTTHDTETLVGYLALLTGRQKQKLAREAGVEFRADDKELSRRFRQALVDSPARIVLIAIQDWLLTGDRINVPGTETEFGDPNWRYRLPVPVERLPVRLFE